MLCIQKEFNTIHRRFLHNVVQSQGDTKLAKHIINVVGKKITGETVDIELCVKAEVLNYGPTIYYEVISNIPYNKDEWIEHPFKNLKMDYDSKSIRVADHINDTPTTRKLIEDLVVPDNWCKYVSNASETYTVDQIKSTIINKIVDLTGMKEDDNFESTDVKIKMRVIAYELKNGQIALKITTDHAFDINERWDLHPFRFLDKSKVSSITGILNDTPAIRQMIADITVQSNWKLYVDYDLSYRAHVISNLYTFFVKSIENTKCKIINDLISCLSVHWS
jgi:hypothetical protein